MTIRHILCPVDNSPTSRHALEQAASLAARLQARVDVLHVAWPMQMASAEFDGLLPPELTRAEEAHIRAWLADDVERVAAAGAPADATLVLGAPAREILARARSLPADLIVIATHGHSGVERLLLGSTTEKVLHRSPCPVLTIPPRSTRSWTIPFRRVLCAVDFSEDALRGIEYALASPLDANAELVLAHVIEWPWHEPPAPAFDELPAHEAEALRRFRAEREEHARQRLAGLEPAGFETRCRTTVAHGKPYAELLRIAEAEAVDLIVIGVRGRGALDMAMFGSTTNQLIRRALCPVLTVSR
jgi:nucleotide-binding universal stress UspA family protein